MRTILKNNVYLDSILKRKSEKLIVLDLRKLEAVVDFFIICHRRSSRQVTALAEHVKSDLKNLNIPIFGCEGIEEGHWALLDYGNVVIHIFQESFRDFYNIEDLWSDAKFFKIRE